MKFSKGKYRLVLIYVAMLAIVAFRVAVHPTNYTTHDSEFYLNQGGHIENILSSENTLRNLTNIKNGFSTWPIGYPLCIAIVCYTTDTSLLVSSKLVNFIFLGLLLMLLYRWFGEKAWFLGMSFFSYGSLEVISETWSETPFIFFVFLLGYVIVNNKKYTPFRLVASLSGCLILLFLFRYVGVIYLGIVGVLGILYFIKKDRTLAYSFLVSVLISSIFIFFYLYTNKLSTGYITGMQRIDVGHQSLFDFVINLGQGLLNESFIARNYFFRGTPDWLFIALMLVQVIVLSVLYKNRNWIKRPFKLDAGTKALIILGFGYLFGIICLKLVIPIDGFDFRILFPFTAPVLLALFASIADSTQKEYFMKVYRVIVLLMVISFISNLPKRYLLTKVNDAFAEQIQQRTKPKSNTFV